ncbi:MAG: hypothetical protein ACRCW9_09945 [Cetobacterium sp.]
MFGVIIGDQSELVNIKPALDPYDFVSYILISDIISSEFTILKNYKVVLDSNQKIFPFLKSKNLEVKKFDGKYDYIEHEGVMVFECPSLNYLFNKKQYLSYTDEHKKEVNFVITRLFHLLTVLGNSFFKTEVKKESFKDLIVNNSKETTFKLVKTLPIEKEQGVEYITLDKAKDLCRIFDVLDSIKEGD